MQKCLLLALLLAVGCASPMPAVHIKASDRGKAAQLQPGQPLVVEFEPGDAIPLRVAVNGSLVDLEPANPPLVLRAKRRFFLRIEGSSIKVSLDGVNFEPPRSKSGSFALGFGVDDGGPSASVGISTPVYDSPR